MDPKLEIGKLNRRLVLQTKPDADSAAVDANGQEVEAWTPVGAYWAAVEPLTGRELVNAQQLRNDVSHKITTRHFGTINPALSRWVMGSRIFNIISSLDINDRHRMTVSLCTEVVSIGS